MTANDILGKIYEAFDNDVAHEITADAAELVVRSIIDCVETGEVVGHIGGIDLGVGITSGDVVVNGEFTYFVGDGESDTRAA